MRRERAFAALFGAYVGCLVAPAASLGLPGPTWPVLFAGFAAVGVAGYATARKHDLAVGLSGFWRNASMVVFPLSYASRFATLPPGLSPIEFFVRPATVGVAAALLGFFVGLTGHNCRVNRTMGDATVHAKFTARTAPESRTWLFVGAGAVGIAGVGSAALFALSDAADPGPIAGAIATAMGTLTTLASASDERDVAITDAGVKIQMQLHDWDAFTDFELTDDALVLERSGRLRPSFEFGRDDVDDLDAVEDALKRYLPRE